MVELAYLLIVGAIAVQFPIGVLMYFDAKRLNLKNPHKYWFGVILPAAGFIVILYYFSKRKSLPKKETGDL